MSLRNKGSWPTPVMGVDLRGLEYVWLDLIYLEPSSGKHSFFGLESLAGGGFQF